MSQSVWVRCRSISTVERATLDSAMAWGRIAIVVVFCVAAARRLSDVAAEAARSEVVGDRYETLQSGRWWLISFSG